ncbi:hypothetical protein MLD38_004934 [Melastoma candidum]|uniref:Uncharacterized protein n=1 Tax=Melastoma candidum TaxID=119954 RepID=A0ACB9S703_9MYRT|nr:hypothetical protein MLD38_004934 [Melastoma candidum]
MKYVRPLSLFKDLIGVKTHAQKGKRLLGLDVGDKYVGLAVSDHTNKIASPLSVLLRSEAKMDLMATDFQCLISELSLGGFVVGYPSDERWNNDDEAPDFSAGYRADERVKTVNVVQVQHFVNELCGTGILKDINYTYWGEAFTTKLVELQLQDLHFHPVQSKTMLDKFAAVGILQEYLDYVNRKLKS